MKIVQVKDKRVAKKMASKLVSKGLVVAQVSSAEDINKPMVRKAHVVIVSQR